MVSDKPFNILICYSNWTLSSVWVPTYWSKTLVLSLALAFCCGCERHFGKCRKIWADTENRSTQGSLKEQVRGVENVKVYTFFILHTHVHIFYPRPGECREEDEGERPSLYVSDSLLWGETYWGQHRDHGEAESCREEVRGAHQRAAEGDHWTAEEKFWAGEAEKHWGPPAPLTGYNQP